MCWAIPLLAVGAGGVQVKSSWCPVVWGFQGVCAGPCSAPLALLTTPLGQDRRDAAAGAAPKHIPVNTLHRHPWAPWEWGWIWDRRGNRNLSPELGCQDGAGSMGQVLPNTSKLLWISCTLEINHSISAQLGLNL